MPQNLNGNNEYWSVVVVDVVVVRYTHTGNKRIDTQKQPHEMRLNKLNIDTLFREKSIRNYNENLKGKKWFLFLLLLRIE